jgi:plasmid stability protein
MPSVRIKNVPEDTHRVLRQRAATAHQSLQEYLRSRVVAKASRPTVREVLARGDDEADAVVIFADAVKAVRADRDRR